MYAVTMRSLAGNLDHAVLMSWVGVDSAQVDVAHLLLQHRASIHTTNSMNETPVSYAEEHMTHLFWWHSASEGDVKGLRRLLARQIGSQVINRLPLHVLRA